MVGAGPAGSTAAYCLAGRGLDVCLIDKQTFPRPKLCAGLLTWKTISLLEILFGTTVDTLKRVGIVNHICCDYRIFAYQSELARGSLDFPFHLVDRAAYDAYWLQRARDAGAKVATGIAATRIRSVDGRIELANGDVLSAHTIIGADGAGSKIRRCAFNTPESRKQWFGQLAMTIEKKCASRSAPPYAALHFGFVPWGYAWSFPSKESQIVGMGSIRAKDDRPFKEGFRNFLSSIDLEDLAGPPWRGHPLPFGNFLKTPGQGRVLLTGDACGLADPLLGEGIYYAHRSAQIAAKAIGTASAAPPAILSAYKKLLNKHVIRELNWIKFYRNLLFIGGRQRRFRGLKLFLRFFPKRLEAAVQGQRPFSRLLLP